MHIPLLFTFHWPDKCFLSFRLTDSKHDELRLSSIQTYTDNHCTLIVSRPKYATHVNYCSRIINENEGILQPQWY